MIKILIEQNGIEQVLLLLSNRWRFLLRDQDAKILQYCIGKTGKQEKLSLNVSINTTKRTCHMSFSILWNVPWCDFTFNFSVAVEFRVAFCLYSGYFSRIFQRGTLVDNS